MFATPEMGINKLLFKFEKRNIMSFAEQKVELFKIVADADEELVDAMLKNILDYYSDVPEAIPDKLIQTWVNQKKQYYSSENKLLIWEEIKSEIKRKL